MRIDKWLWAVRLFKTRTQASEACKKGKVKILGDTVKASREIKPGDEIALRKGVLNLKLKVKSLLPSRVGAKLVHDYLEDLTPPEEYEKLKPQEDSFYVSYDGKGRPTKKDRRDIDRLMNFDDDDEEE